jgi:hypothetical protein
VLLRDLAKEPKNQPDALEFVNSETAKFTITGVGTIECSELEFGTTVVKNPGVTLALPFGVAEGDNCSLAGVGLVPTYFDTTEEGAVGNAATKKVATITITEPVAGTFVAMIHDLKFSQSINGKFCTANVDGAEGKLVNSEGPFVEEKTPNLEARFEKVAVKVTGTECPEKSELTANFFVETPSTATDTVWLK